MQIASAVLIVGGVLVSPMSAAGPIASTRDISIDATSFEVDGKQNIVVASGDVVVKQGDVTIVSEFGTYFQLEQKVILTGKVKVKRESMLLTCDKAIAYGGEGRIEVTGNVVFTYGDIKGAAGMGTYDRRAQTVRLSGRPKVWQNRDELTGNVIQVDIQRSKVITYGAARAIFSFDKFSGR